MGLLSGRKEKKAEEQRLVDEMNASHKRYNEVKEEFRPNFDKWLEALAAAQAQTGDTQLTENMLETVGGVPVPDRSGLGPLGATELNAFLRSYVPTLVERRYGGQTPSFWRSVLSYVQGTI
jgi:hypothetical protein